MVARLGQSPNTASRALVVDSGLGSHRNMASRALVVDSGLGSHKTWRAGCWWWTWLGQSPNTASRALVVDTDLGSHQIQRAGRWRWTLAPFFDRSCQSTDLRAFCVARVPAVQAAAQGRQVKPAARRLFLVTCMPASLCPRACPAQRV